MPHRICLPAVVVLVALALAGCPPTNNRPTADAGPDQTVQLGDTVTLDGTGSSDPDGDPLSYQWQVVSHPDGSRVVLGSQGTTTPQFTPDYPGTYILSLTVLDLRDSSDPDRVTVTVEGALVSVPDVTGMTRAEAEAALTVAGLTAGNVSMESSTTVPAGQVIRQDPAADTESLPGAAVDLVISTGPDRVTVPDVAGQSQNDAAAAVTGAGLVPALDFTNSDTVNAGVVISQSPAADTEVDQGTAVTLVVSLGPESQNQVGVPNVLGLSEAEAQTTIDSANLIVDAISFTHSDAVAAGLVVFQSPVAGTIVAIGSEVDLIISLGPESSGSVAVPDVAGLTQAAAATAIGAAGLTVGTVTEAASVTVPAGAVVSTNPPAHEIVDNGSSVDLVLSSGPPQIAVPDLVGLTQAEAAQALADAGFVLGAVSFAGSGSAAPGTVIEQDPAFNAMAEGGSTVAIVIAAAPVTVQQGGSFSIHDAVFGTGGENVLRPHTAVADAATGRIYIGALLTRYIGVYDTTSGAIAGVLDSGFALPGEKKLYLDSGGGALHVFDAASLGLARIDLATGMVSASATLDTAPLDIAIDAAGGVVYLTRDASPGLLLLDGATLAQDSTSTQLDGVSGDLVFDSANSRLLVLNTGLEAANGELRIYDPAGDTVSVTVSFSMPRGIASVARELAYDPANDRFFVRSDLGLGVYDIDGSNPRSLPKPANMDLVRFLYDPASDRLIALALEHPGEGGIANRGAFLLTYNPNPGQTTSPLDTIAAGEANAYMALDTSTNTLLTPDSSTGTVWTITTSPLDASASPVPLGVNIDRIVFGGSAIFGASRFGNSILIRLDPESDAFETFQSGTWPAALSISGSGSAARLNLVNAWDSTVARFSLGAGPSPQDALDTGLPTGTTERLPELAVNGDGSRIAVAYPEFGRIAVLSVSSGAVVSDITVPNFVTGADPAGTGQLQIAYYGEGETEYLFALDKAASTLHRYAALAGTTPLGSTDLSGALAGMGDAPETGWLYADRDNSRLYVGPARTDFTTGLTTGETLPDSQVVLAGDSLFAAYWTVSQTAAEAGITATLRLIRPGDSTPAADPVTLGTVFPIAPEFAFDTENRRFYVANPATAVIGDYTY